jgi:hypothetical protein
MKLRSEKRTSATTLSIKAIGVNHRNGYGWAILYANIDEAIEFQNRE